MIRVLHLFTELDGGGVERFLYNYYINMDRTSIRFDFVVPGEKIGFLEASFQKMGSQIYHISTVHENSRLQLKQVSEIIRKGKYDVVHCHGYRSVLGILFAKHRRVPIRICHSHMAFEEETFAQRVLRWMIVQVFTACATQLCACGKDAARWLYGERRYRSERVLVINNAVDTREFTYSQELREQVRKELQIEDKFVIGNVARLSYQKNHQFLIGVFAQILKVRPDAVLIIVGDGPFRGKLEAQAQEAGIASEIRFLGNREDVPALLTAMDVFVLTSHYEGLPVTLVETQAASLVSFASDNITTEIKITDYLNYLPLVGSPESWCDAILNAPLLPRRDLSEQILEGGYSITHEADKLYDLYFELLRVKKTK